MALVGPPKHLTTTERDALTTAERAEGTVIYNTTTSSPQQNVGTAASPVWFDINAFNTNVNTHINNSPASVLDTAGFNAVTETNGKEVLFDTGVSNGTWHFRYDSSIVGASKWRFLGGPSLINFVNQDESLSGGYTSGYVDLSTVGPSISVPLTGTYEVSLGSLILIVATGTARNASVSLSIGGSTPSSADQCLVSATTSTSAQVGRTYTKSLVISNAIKMQYAASVGGANAEFNYRWLSIRPIVVSKP